MTTTANASPLPQAGTPSSQNGAGQNPLADLAALVSAMNTPAASEPEVVQPSAPQADPETAPAPPAEAEAGQESLPAETPPQADADEAQASGDSQDTSEIGRAHV